MKEGLGYGPPGCAIVKYISILLLPVTKRLNLNAGHPIKFYLGFFLPILLFP